MYLIGIGSFIFLDVDKTRVNFITVSSRTGEKGSVLKSCFHFQMSQMIAQQSLQLQANPNIFSHGEFELTFINPPNCCS